MNWAAGSMYLAHGLDRLLWRDVEMRENVEFEPRSMLVVEATDLMALAMFVHSKFPELSIKEVFQALDDPVFLVLLSQVLKEVCVDG